MNPLKGKKKSVRSMSDSERRLRAQVDRIYADMVSKLDALHQADIEKAQETWKALSRSERSKFVSLFGSPAFEKAAEEAGSVAEMERAAEREGVSRELLAKFMVCVRPYTNFLRLIASALLMRGKLRGKKLLQDDSLTRAKMAAENLKDARWLSEIAAENNDKRFFVDLGKCLSGEIQPGLFDRKSRDLAFIFCANPEISEREAIRKMKFLGWQLQEGVFRKWKSRLGLGKSIGKRDASDSRKM